MKVQRTCECCRQPFTARSADVNRGWARFCSKRCKAIKQEAIGGGYAGYKDREAQRDHEYAMADQSWGEHEVGP